ncbi:MAG: TIGR01458 family HAD-type hydrolase [Bryobacterales bacterium]|nr:TIGR01458 family HAD-type hydrolase [Bryobacterales bacterium]
MRGILFDMDGVLYNSAELIPGAVETVRWVRKHSIPHLFATNTSSRDRSALVEKLHGFGIPAVEDDLITPASSAAEWLRQSAVGPIALFVRPATRREFAGLACLDDNAEQGAAHVVIGDLGTHWDYATLNRAFRLLHHNPGAQLIALGMTRYWLASDGISLDVAPFVAALQHATGRVPIVLGKPDARFFLSAAERLRLPPAEILMIGDDIDADVGGAQAAGLKSALVRTGKFRPADLDGAVRPDVIWDSVADLPRWWQNTAR